MLLHSQSQVEDMIYRSYLRAVPNLTKTLDEQVRKPQLTRALLDLSGSPDRDQRYILVTGSKGKGSTSRLISSLLGHMGYKVGLFTSPHLVDFTERIRVNGRAIAAEDFVRLGNAVSEGFNRIEGGLAEDEYQGPVGVALAIAALYFREQQTDFTVVECGRGGTFDDTNVLDNRWAVITPIMEEHTANLGPDLENIIRHKLGIIKPATEHLYISQQKPQILGMIQKQLREDRGGSAAHAEQTNAFEHYYGEGFRARQVSTRPEGTCFEVETARAVYEELTLPLLGEFQALNAAAAIAVCEDIADGPLDAAMLRSCLGQLQWPGRCEIISRQPLTIVDGAIHRDSARYVAELMQTLNPNGGMRVTAIIGVPQDKDYAGVMEVLSGVADRLIVTAPNISHLHFPEDALAAARTLQEESLEFSYLSEALAYLAEHDPSSVILIVGTQTLIGNAKRHYGQSLLDIGL
ncbi:bifunctional folylpolyglutamate synthase/dihydrofolate synthase [Paenibacillus donghaensis]|uniref:tetrahydrofolate synthase n=1 Tax=Paenibacillus donghaensis TaxID=414771 RepID=A0A2Z2KQZ6_9BACL|nr:Mur ligase family protein [Paenibacillus donghaensis]ASA25189.1 hypothetical protein B9T62_33335 [Paenibacillus donghaensis]